MSHSQIMQCERLKTVMVEKQRVGLKKENTILMGIALKKKLEPKQLLQNELESSMSAEVKLSNLI